MRFVRGDVKGPHRFNQNRPRTFVQRYNAVQRQGSLKINFREILGVVRFSTFATLSDRTGLALYSSRAATCDTTCLAIVIAQAQVWAGCSTLSSRLASSPRHDSSGTWFVAAAARLPVL